MDFLWHAFNLISAIANLLVHNNDTAVTTESPIATTVDPDTEG